MTTKNFYDTLGIDKTASPEKIKRAYRRKAASVHPDRGGDGEEMAELNRAYTCLRDPQARLAYDATGEEQKPFSLNAMAIELITQKFTEALSKGIVEGHVLAFAKDELCKEIRNHNKQLRQARQAIGMLATRRNSITVKEGMNLWQAVIDQQVKQITAVTVKIERDIEMREHALKLLNGNYHEQAPAPLFDMTMAAGGMNAGLFWTDTSQRQP